MNPEDYEIRGITCKAIAGEDLAFGDSVKFTNDKRVFRFTDKDEEYTWLGWAAEHVKSGEEGTILLQGHFIPIDHKQEYLTKVKKGIAFEIFRAIGFTFGFEVSLLEDTE